jgi:hypothetical protein
LPAPEHPNSAPNTTPPQPTPAQLADLPTSDLLSLAISALRSLPAASIAANGIAPATTRDLATVLQGRALALRDEATDYQRDPGLLGAEAGYLLRAIGEVRS